MRITRLSLTEIRRHRRLDLAPAPGLTVIRGPNESGKSTIQLGLELVLFRRATTTAAEFSTVRSWDATEDPLIELTFEQDGRPGRLAKRFAGTKGSVRLELDGVVDTDPARVDQLLGAAIGIPSEKFFRSTASVRHFEMEDLDRDERALRDRLQQSIGGGDVGASKARARLDETIRRIKAAGAKNPGPLLRARDDIARLSADLRAGELALDQLTRDRAALAAATAARLILEEEVRIVTTSLDEAETAARLDGERRTDTQQYERSRRAADLAERLAAAEAAPQVAAPVAVIRPAVERLRALELGRAQLAAERAAVVVPPLVLPPVPAAPMPRPVLVPGSSLAPGPSAMPGPPVVPGPAVVPAGERAGPWRPLAIGLGVLAIVAFLVGVAVAAIGPVIGLVAAIVLGAFAGAAWVVGSRAAAREEAGSAATAAAADAERARLAAFAEAERVTQVAAAETYRLQQAAVADAEARRQTAQAEHEVVSRQADEARAAVDARLAANTAEASRLTGSLGVADLPAAEALLLTAERHSAAVDGLRAELRGSLGITAEAPLPSPAELAHARDEAAAKAALGGHALTGLGAAGADPESARSRAQTALRGARMRLQQAVDEEGQAKGRVSQNAADAEAVAAVSEALASRQEDLVALERRLRIYEQTLIAITAAEAATMQKAARYLERRMGADMARITGGRYDRVRVDENDLDITVWSPEREAWVGASQLSKGTGDQLYLAARLGLVRQVTQDRRPPLVFDDPFVTFDDERALRAFELLRELAADHQVLYLTCSDRYDAAADTVITLPAPVVVHVEPGSVPEPPARTEPFELTLPFGSALTDA